MESSLTLDELRRATALSRTTQSAWIAAIDAYCRTQADAGEIGTACLWVELRPTAPVPVAALIDTIIWKYKALGFIVDKCAGGVRISWTPPLPAACIMPGCLAQATLYPNGRWLCAPHAEEEDSVAYPPSEEEEVALPAPAGLLGSCDRCARPAVYKGGHGVTFCEKHRCQWCLGDPRPHVTMAGKTTCIKCSETKKREREADGEEKEPKRRRIHHI